MIEAVGLVSDIADDVVCAGGSVGGGQEAKGIAIRPATENIPASPAGDLRCQDRPDVRRHPAIVSNVGVQSPSPHRRKFRQ